MSDNPFGAAMQGMDDMLFRSWFPILFVLGFSLLYWFRSYMRGAQMTTNRTMKGKTILITGGNGGIGKEIALELAYRGARVILACRDKGKGDVAVAEIRKKTRNLEIVNMKLDLNSFKSINSFVKDFLKTEEKLDVLINNAGIILHPKASKTEDGFEIHLQSNYLGHFMLTHKLLDLVKKAKPSRIVNVSAVAYTLGKLNIDDVNFDSSPDYTESMAYSQSKLAVMMFTKAMSRKLMGTGVTINSVHPGVVMTEGHKYLGYYCNAFVRYSLYPIIWLMTKSAPDGAQTTLNCAIAEELETVTGKYFVDCIETKTDNICLDDGELVEKFYQKSLEWCKIQE